MTVAPIPPQADAVFLPRLVDGGEVSNLVDPGGTPIDLWLLE